MTEAAVKSIFKSPPEFETDRLILRAIRACDRNDMFEYACDREVTRYLTWKPHRDPSFTKRYIESVLHAYSQGDFYDFALVLKANKKMIGTCGFTSFNYETNSCEVGYVLNPRYRGYALIPEALNAVMEMAFKTFCADRVYARYIIGNDGSRRVMEKCGMKYGGEDSPLYLNGSWVRVAFYEITCKEYFALSQNRCVGI